VNFLAGLAIPLALSTGLLAWTVRGLRRNVAALRARVDMLEHPERYPPQHINCRCL
jgi:hypothetical protein